MLSLTRCSSFLALALFFHTSPAQSDSKTATGASVAANNCDNLPHSDHPTARINNERLNAVIFLPDAKRGFYRGPRFDWSGIVGCVSLNGHTFFGEWFDHYDPSSNDAVTGPAEEFRHPTSELGYDEASPGGLFMKVGVGLLKRVDNSPYTFGGAYPIVDHGKWTIKIRKKSIVFTQELHTPIGYAYMYSKVLSLDEHSNILTLQHHLKNIGARPIDTDVYDHDFFMLDRKHTGPQMELRLPFSTVAETSLPDTVQIDGKTIRFTAPLQPAPGVGTYVSGYSGKISDYNIVFEDNALKIGVEQTADSPISKFYLWATPRTVCPEAYIAIHVLPGASQDWTIHYRFFTD